MPPSNKKKCDRCYKLKSDIELCGDDLLCRSCEVQNATQLTKTKFGCDNVPDCGNADAVQARKNNDTPPGNDSNEPCLACAPLYAKLLNELQVLRDAHSQIKKEVSELKQDSMSRSNETNTIVGQLSNEVADIKATLISKQNEKDAHTGMKYAATAVHLDNVEKHKRSCNVVIRGLKPDCDKTDVDLFLEMCESNLPVKPVVRQDHCRRLGKQQGDRIRPFLVQLENEQSVADLLKSRSYLKDSAEYKDVYINPDLTPSEAEAAFLLRQKRRDRRRNQAASYPRDTHPTQSSMVHGVTSLSLTAPAFNPAGSQRT